MIGKANAVFKINFKENLTNLAVWHCDLARILFLKYLEVFLIIGLDLLESLETGLLRVCLFGIFCFGALELLMGFENIDSTDFSETTVFLLVFFE